MTTGDGSTLLVRTLITTPSAKRGLFVCCLNAFAAENYVAYMCIEQFSREKKKSQALLICKWFIDDDPPEGLSSIITSINMISSDMKAAKTEATQIKNQIGAIGKTFKAKITKHGGGLSGFIGALKQKATTSTKLSGSFFDTLQENSAMNILAAIKQGGDIDSIDETAAPKARFINHIMQLKRELKTNNFDPDSMGIYA